MVQMFPIRDVNTTPGKFPTSNCRKSVKKWNGQDGERHAQGHRGRPLQRTMNSEHSDDQADQHASSIPQENTRGGKVVDQEPSQRASQRDSDTSSLETPCQESHTAKRYADNQANG